MDGWMEETVGDGTELTDSSEDLTLPSTPSPPGGRTQPSLIIHLHFAWLRACACLCGA